ncbi:hypothetical protein [Streptomyces sp. NPDC056244]|uniref:Lsr2 family DNA-binding protein n=1 Tax=Streptomyces sp. NPDC056244 TaxID=3345762 RepID=UPI0035DE8092
MPSARPTHENCWPDHPAALEAGVCWDAVRVSADSGHQILALVAEFGLGPRIGPVIADHDQGMWWFLVGLGSHNEPWPPNAAYLTTGSVISVPPRHGGPDDAGLRWIKAPGPVRGHEFTDALTLLTCLDVIGERRRLAAGHVVRDESAHQVNVPYTSVRLPLRTGTVLLDRIRSCGQHVGPVMLCRSHGILHVLVPPGEADTLPRVPGVLAVTEGSTDCGHHGRPRRWLLPPAADPQALTRVDTLTAALQRPVGKAQASSPYRLNVRAWAKENRIPVGEFGPIPQSIFDRYEKAHGAGRSRS